MIIAQPQNAQGKIGDTVSFTVEAENVAAYQWQYSKDGGETFRNTGVSGSKTQTMLIQLTATTATYYWRCKLTGEDGEEVFSEAVSLYPMHERP